MKHGDVTMNNTRSSCASLAIALALSGCAGFGGTTPQAATAMVQQSLHADAPPAIDGVAGMYKGLVTNGPLKGKAVVQLTQTGTSVGGSMTETFGKQTYQAILSLTATAAGDSSGVAIVMSSPPCSLNITGGKYDPKTLMLTGNYKGFNNCSFSGRVAVKERCYYTVGTPKAEAIAPRTVPIKC